MSEMDIREMAGVVSSFSDHRIWLKEGKSAVIFEASSTSEIHLNASSARRLARQLNRMAARVEKRMDFEAELKTEAAPK